MSTEDTSSLLQEFEPLSHLLGSIPTKAQRGFNTYDLELTCIDVSDDYIALGSNVGTVFLYDRGKGTTQRLHCEPKHQVVTCIKLKQCLDDLIAAGLQSGAVSVFQLPSNLPGRCRQLQQFNVSGVHKSRISCLEFSSNGMKLFTGDNDGVVCLVELLLDEAKCLSSLLLNENREIIQLQYNYFTLLVSTKLRTVLCKTNGDNKIIQVGTKERKCLGHFGACYKNDLCKASEAKLFASRPGFRIWQADIEGNVSATFMFKDYIAKATPNIPLALGVRQFITLANPTDKQFGPLLNFGEDSLVTWNDSEVYVLNIVERTLLASSGHIGPICGVAAHEDEIFILRMGLSERRVLRIAKSPENRAGTGHMKLQALTSAPPSSGVPRSPSDSPRHSPQSAARRSLQDNDLASSTRQSPLSFKPITNFFDKLKKKPIFQGGNNANFVPVVSESSSNTAMSVAVHKPQALRANDTTNDSTPSKSELPPIVKLNSPDMIKLEISDEHEESKADKSVVKRNTHQEITDCPAESRHLNQVVDITKTSDNQLRDQTKEFATRLESFGNQQDDLVDVTSKYVIPSVEVVDTEPVTGSREALLQRISEQDYESSIVFATSVKPKKGKKKKKGKHRDSDSVTSGDGIVDNLSQNSRSGSTGVSPIGTPTYSPRPMSPVRELSSQSPQPRPTPLEDDLYTSLILPDRIQTKVSELQIKRKSPAIQCGNSSNNDNASHKNDEHVVPSSENKNDVLSDGSLVIPQQDGAQRSKSPLSFVSRTFEQFAHPGRQVAQENSDLVPVISRPVIEKHESHKSLETKRRSKEKTPEYEMPSNFVPIDQVHLANEDKLLETLMSSDEETPPEDHVKQELLDATKSDNLREQISLVESKASEAEEYDVYGSMNKQPNVKRQESIEFDIYGKHSSSEPTTEKLPEDKSSDVEENTQLKLSENLYSKYSSHTSSGYSSSTSAQGGSSNHNSSSSKKDDSSFEQNHVLVSHLWPKIAESWMSYTASGNIQSLSVSAKHVWYVDKSENAYCSLLSSPALIWKKVDQPAKQLTVAPSGNIVWRLHKNSVYAGSKITTKYPWGMKWVCFATEVSFIALDDTCGWYIKNNGDLMYQPSLSKDRPTYRSFKPIGPPVEMVRLACGRNVVWGLTNQHDVLVRANISKTVPGGTEWRKLDTKTVSVDHISVSDIAIGTDSLAWILDTSGRVWCRTGVTMETPEGQGSWWQVSSSEFLVNDQGKAFETLEKVNDLTQNLTKLLSPTYGGLIAAGSQGVWTCPDFKNTIQSCRGSLIGHQWLAITPSGMASSTKWSTVNASVAYGDHGLVWSVQPNGDMFCFSPATCNVVNIERPRISSSKSIIHISCCQVATWALINDGKVFIRDGVGTHCPTGASWVLLDLEQLGDSRLINFSCGLQNVWAVDARGTIYLRIGAKAAAARYLNPAWVPVDNEPAGLGSFFTQVVTSPNDEMVWAIDCRKYVYVRAGITDMMPIGTGWKQVHGTHAQQLCVSNDTVWALSPSGDILCRYGITQSNFCGDYWRKLPGNFSSFSVSADNRIWAISRTGQLFQHQARHLLESEEDANARTQKTSDDWELI